ncbi:hypothetical protein [uncultured Fibrobacter sp.]|uniref:hypothetical protein n=1 Tax=uncultured Fibrobacter sp. TaxID=261512 RepID=UPI0025EDF5C1|nr:hypothetical protein [uncultured Fibrobacter sp.]
MKTRLYEVAGHVFSVGSNLPESAGVDLFALMDNYEPFAVPSGNGNASESPLFTLAVEHSTALPGFIEETRQEDEGQEILCGHDDAGSSMFNFRLRGADVGTLLCSSGYVQARLVVPDISSQNSVKFAVNNSLMVLYALATANLGTALFHSATVGYRGKGYMFLGQSGTGKSTHARLWLRYNEGSALLNDDNPVVRFFAPESPAGVARAVVYGSPWSGKTPCYKNENLPLGGIVLLSQAPFNKIERLRGVKAYAALVPSISGKRWERLIADGLHYTENALASNVPLWYLECLPDESAARLCRETIVDVIDG